MNGYPSRLDRSISPAVRGIAGELSSLFDRDRELVLALNGAQRRLEDANEQLTASLSADALRAVYGPIGPDLGLSGRKPPVLAAASPVSALERIADRIRRAFIAYQDAAESRRQLAFDVAEVNARLIAAMATDGSTDAESRAANVHELAAGRFKVPDA